ncbi:MAG: hypothetical protein PVF51_06400 [Nitrospirota bacterium]|jgi:hypothetical protein
MTIPSFHFDIEEDDGQFRAVCTEFDGLEVSAPSREEAIETLVRKLAEQATQRTAAGESLPPALYSHHRPL